jgi:cell division protease FtsH
MAGPERRSRVMSEHEKRVIAYHEAGHALVGHVLPDGDEVHKVSIVSRGRALGLTWYLPEDRYTMTKAQLEAQMAAVLGGRTAEELVFGEITTGAANDIEKCTEIARAMVTQYGMSRVLGPRKFGQDQGEVFLGRDYGATRDYSDDIASRIDGEVASLIDEAHATARAVLVVHRAVLDALADELIENETVDADDLARLFKDVTPWSGPPDGREDEQPSLTRVRPVPVVDEPRAVPVGASGAAPLPAKERVLRRWARWRRATRPETS